MRESFNVLNSLLAKDEAETNRRNDIANKELEYIKQNELPDPNTKNMPFRYLNTF